MIKVMASRSPSAPVRVYIASDSLFVESVDLAIEAYDRGAARRDVMAALAATGLWVGAAYNVTRLTARPSGAFDLSQINNRLMAGDVLYGALAGTVDEVRLVRIVDWAFAPWISVHRQYLNVDSWDASRTATLEAMRTSALAPWLAGARPVRDLEVFRAFHVALSAEERFALRLISYWSRYGAGIPVGMTGRSGWFATASQSLIAGAWAEIGPPAQGYARLRPGRLVRRLALGQGELLEA